MSAIIQPRISYDCDGASPSRRAIIRAMEVVTGQRRLQRLYNALAPLPLNGENFWGTALNALNIRVRINSGHMSNLPAEGPVLVVANHPFGVVDGLALCHLVAQQRLDYKVILHKVLCQDQRVAKHVLPIDFAGSREAAKANVQSKRNAEQTLHDGGVVIVFPAGGVVIVFPAGGVATAERWRTRATDLSWKPLSSKLIQRTQAQVLPVYFHGENSRAFQASSLLSPTLRAGLLLHEVKNKMGREVVAEVGEIIPRSTLEALGDVETISEHLRRLVYNLPSGVVSQGYDDDLRALS